MAARNNYFDVAADVGSEEEDEDYDEETGEPTRKPKKSTGDVHDSSEEEEEDDDEEAAREVSTAILQVVFQLTRIYRSHKASSRTRMKRTRRSARHAKNVDASAERGGGKSASRKTKFWTKKTWTSLASGRMIGLTSR